MTREFENNAASKTFTLHPKAVARVSIQPLRDDGSSYSDQAHQ